MPEGWLLPVVSFEPVSEAARPLFHGNCFRRPEREGESHGLEMDKAPGDPFPGVSGIRGAEIARVVVRTDVYFVRNSSL
jgi:hypothetical protein